MSRSTKKQNEILEYIEDFCIVHPIPPTILQIANHFGRSRTTIFEHLCNMENKGLLVKTHYRSRKYIPKISRRILTDQQLIELHNDIRDGKTVLVSTEYRDRFEAAVRKLLAWFPDTNKVGCVINKEMDISTPFVETLNEVIRLLGPEPKEPPDEPKSIRELKQPVVEVSIDELKKEFPDRPEPKEPPEEEINLGEWARLSSTEWPRF